MIDEEYCVECGCEILSPWDIGYLREETEVVCFFPGIPAEEIERVFVVCRSCMEEDDRAWEEFKQSPEYQYECDYQRWCDEQFCEPSTRREVNDTLSEMW